jgi:pSer/pThr/pTyr-binding forkhead associated (FHA) protein
LIQCDHCGAQNDASSRFCKDCGWSFDRVARKDTIPPFPTRASEGSGAATCPQCGQPLSHHRRSAPLRKPIGLSVLDEAGQVLASHELKREETSIGRIEADIAFEDDPFISPIHAQFSVRGDEIYVRDLGSRNGTWVFIEEPYVLQDGDLMLVGSQVIRFRRLGYPGPQPPEQDQTRRLGSSTPGADIASLTQLRGDGSPRDVVHLSPGRDVAIGRERGDWVFPYDLSMSGQHAEVRSHDADFVVVDHESRNGVGVAVRGEQRLHRGARLLMGDRILRIDPA